VHGRGRLGDHRDVRWQGDANDPTREAYRFGSFTLDIAQHVVTRDGMPVPITPKAFDILLFLLQHANQTVAKQDLMKAVWPDTFVQEGTVTQNIPLLRKALAEHDENSALIVTVARQGYRLSAQVAVACEVISGDAAVASGTARRSRASTSLAHGSGRCRGGDPGDR
jgi:DNA-binding winged helix-turn-helix (wHTH) protein